MTVAANVVMAGTAGYRKDLMPDLINWIVLIAILGGLAYALIRIVIWVVDIVVTARFIKELKDPETSAERLRLIAQSAGRKDPDWLRAVSLHENVYPALKEWSVAYHAAATARDFDGAARLGRV